MWHRHLHWIIRPLRGLFPIYPDGKAETYAISDDMDAFGWWHFQLRTELLHHQLTADLAGHAECDLLRAVFDEPRRACGLRRPVFLAAQG